MKRALFTRLLLLAVASPVLAADDSPGTRHAVIVPYDVSKPISEQEPSRFFLDYEAFEKLWAAAKEYRLAQNAGDVPGAGAATDHVLTSALYRGAARQDRLEIEGRLTLLTRGKAWQKVPLTFSGVNLSRIELDGAAASYQDGAILIEKAGRHLVTVTFEVPLPAETGAGGAGWRVPSASATLLALTMDSEVAEPVINGGLPLVKSSDPASGATVFTAALGQASDLEFRRRLKSTGRGMTQPSVAVIDSHLFVSPALERLEASFHLEFAGQEETRFVIAFDPSVTPVRFDIPNLANWNLEEATPETDGLRRLAFELTRPVRDRLSITMVGERLIDELAAPRRYPALAAGAVRIEQRRSLLTTSELSLKPEAGSRHRQTDFRAGGVDIAGFRPVGAYALTGAEEALTFTLAEETPERRATADYVFQVSREKLETIGQFQLRSPGASLLDFTVGLPAGATIQAVEGNRVKDWWRTGNSLFVRFSGDTPEVTALLVYVTESLDGTAAEVDLSPFSLPDLEAEQVSGSGLVVAHVTRDTTLRFQDGTREVGADEVAGDFEVLAPLERKRGFRFEGSGFSGRVALTDIAPRYDASWVMLAQAHESWLRLSIQADIEVTRSAVDRVTFSTAAATPEFRLLSPEIREVRTTENGDRRDYEIVFQHHVTGAINFTLETEIPHAGSGSLPDVDFPGATRLERYLIVENQSRDRIDIDPAGLDPTVRDLLPFVPETLGSAQFFRARPGWELGIAMEKLETSAGNEAVVLFAELNTALRANGEEWLRAVYRLQNRSLQFLPVDLPEGAELVSVTVAGVEARADRGRVDGREVVLIPLIQTRPGQLAYEVSLVLRRLGDADRSPGRLTSLKRRLDDPEIVGLGVERTLWSVFLPAGHELADVGGNMNRVEARANVIEKLEASLAELEQLNALGQSDSVDGETLELAFSNGQSIVERIEQEARDNGIALGGELKSKLARQKVVLSENRIRMPLFQGQQRVEILTIGGGFQGKDIDWGDNSAEILTRNNDFENKQAEQLDRLNNQVRLNDNIAIGNAWINNETLAERGKGDDDAGQNTEQAGELRKQVEKLSVNDGGGEQREVEAKLNTLNYAQIGHGGGSRQVEVADPFADAPAMTQNYLGFGRQSSDPEDKKRDAGRAGEESAMKAPVSSSLVSRNARQDIQIAPAAPMSQPAEVPVAQAPDGGGAVVSAGLASLGETPLDETFRAGGRRSVSVDFPVEGEAYHFQKVKGNAELHVVSREPADLERGRWLLWLVAVLAVMLGADSLLKKRRPARA